MKKILSCVLVFALISVPLTSQIFANPSKTNQFVSLTDDQKPLIKETDSKKMSTTKKILIALSSCVALATGIGFALYRGIENNIPTTDKDISHEESTKDGNDFSSNCGHAYYKCFLDTFSHSYEKSSFNISYVKQMANDLISCVKPSCSDEDIQNNGAYFDPEIVAQELIKFITKKGKSVVYED